MKKVNSRLIASTIILLAILAVSPYGVSAVMADNELKYPSIVTKLAQKFNLNEEAVNQVFKEEQADMWQNRQA